MVITMVLKVLNCDFQKHKDSTLIYNHGYISGLNTCSKLERNLKKKKMKVVGRKPP
jgi:hypothetical protein